MKLLRLFLCALVAGLCAAPLGAQEFSGTVRGRVTDAATQQPLVGVTVTIGNRFANSQQDGRYVVRAVPAGSHTVQARMIGYAVQSQPVSIAGGDTAVVDFALTGSAIGLSEVVVVGYGEQRVGDITGAVTAVTPAEFNTGRVVSPEMLIQSKVPGVQVVESNDPGGGISIRIRGATSITASSEPLYVVDGVPLGTGAGGGLSAGRNALNFINPNDIEDITVLRDQSAASIYGTNAANGVVLITTKSGQGRQGSSLEYTSNASTSTVDRLPSMMNASQFAAAVATYAPSRVDSLMGQNTNWFNAIDRTGFGQEHNVAFASAASDMNYRLSFGYLKQEGIIQASSTQRMSLALNYRQRLFDDRLSITTSIRGSRAVDHFTPGDVLGNAAAMAPTQPIFNPTSPTGYWDWNTTNASPSNPLASITLSRDHGTTLRSLGNMQARYQLPIEGLTGTLNLGYDITKTDRTIFTPNNLAAQIRQGQGLFFLQNNTENNALLEAYGSYAPPVLLGPGRANLVAGYSYAQQHGEYPFVRETGLTTNLLGDNGIPAANNVVTQRDVADYKLISLFGRFNYNISDRYLFAASVRRDGSSRFGPQRQWGTFPSLAVAWRLSQEPFLQNSGSISDLKLRVSWAKTGNQAINNYLFTSTYTYSDNQSKVWFGDQFVNTIRPSAVDEFIHWESTNSYNVGLDFGFSNQRFSGSLDLYRKNTSDLIFNVPVAAGTTLGNFVTTNIGRMKNQGIEASLNAQILATRERGLGWMASLTASHNTNELLSIDPAKAVTRVLVGGISGGVGNLIEILQPGHPIRSFFVYEQRYDAAGKPIYDTGTPTNMYVDQPTVLDSVGCPAGPTCVGLYRPDGIINDADRRPFHDPSPKWILGHTSYLTYGDFDLTFTMRAYLGNYVYNNVASSNGAYQNLGGSGMPSNLHTSVLETGFVVPQYYSDYFVEDASFLRMDNITLGYSGSFRGQPFRIYGVVQNAFTMSGYSGVDPTAGLEGIDNNIYPRSRTFTTGVSFRF